MDRNTIFDRYPLPASIVLIPVFAVQTAEWRLKAAQSARAGRYFPVKLGCWRAGFYFPKGLEVPLLIAQIPRAVFPKNRQIAGGFKVMRVTSKFDFDRDCIEFSISVRKNKERW